MQVLRIPFKSRNMVRVDSARVILIRMESNMRHQVKLIVSNVISLLIRKVLTLEVIMGIRHSRIIQPSPLVVLYS